VCVDRNYAESKSYKFDSLFHLSFISLSVLSVFFAYFHAVFMSRVLATRMSSQLPSRSRGLLVLLVLKFIECSCLYLFISKGIKCSVLANVTFDHKVWQWAIQPVSASSVRSTSRSSMSIRPEAESSVLMLVEFDIRDGGVARA